MDLLLETEMKGDREHSGRIPQRTVPTWTDIVPHGSTWFHLTLGTAQPMREISKHFKIWMNWVRVKNLEVTYELEVYSERERERHLHILVAQA